MNTAGHKRSAVIKRSIVIGGHKTSISMEDPFWAGLKKVAGERAMTLSQIVGEIDEDRTNGNLSSAVRLFVLDYYQTAAALCAKAA
jgi:predicted DNA-binding ribbon-helix-helix protein